MDRSFRVTIVQATIGADLESRHILQGRYGICAIAYFGTEELIERYRWWVVNTYLLYTNEGSIVHSTLCFVFPRSSVSIAS